MCVCVVCWSVCMYGIFRQQSFSLMFRFVKNIWFQNILSVHNSQDRLYFTIIYIYIYIYMCVCVCVCVCLHVCVCLCMIFVTCIVFFSLSKSFLRIYSSYEACMELTQNIEVAHTHTHTHTRTRAWICLECNGHQRTVVWEKYDSSYSIFSYG